MIRINLLPQKKQRKADAGQKQLVYMAFSWLVVLGGVVVFHMSVQSDLDGIVRDNQVIQADIERFKAELGDYDKVRAQREELMRQQDTIKSLEEKRTGPVFLLRELSEILTPAKGPTFDRLTYEETVRRDPNSGFNAAWDTRRVWLESFEEQERSVKIKGAAKSNEDVAEFLKRLQASVFFKDVVLESTSAVSTSRNDVKHMTFNLSTGVIY